MADQNFTVNCGFFNSMNNDRVYNANQMNKPYRRLVSNGIFATPNGTASTDLQVLSEGDGMNISVKAGEGIFNDKWFENQTKIVIAVPSNTTLLPRRDSVIVQVDERSSGRVGQIVYRTGEPASSPLPPNINIVTDVHEYRIANIYVASGATNINQDAIVDLRGSSECPWVTHLLYQVDTSQLYNQWQNAYQNYYDTETERFDAFMKSLTEQITVNTNIITYESHYTTPTDVTTVVPINIASYNKAKDVLMVRINHLFASETTDYTISDDSTKITLIKDLDANQSVDFIVLQSVVSGDTATMIEEIRALNTTITNATGDTDWIDFTLENGVTSFDDTTNPACRKYGKQTFIRGAIKNITTVGVTICTLPNTMCPLMNHQFTSCVFSSGTISGTVVIEITTAGAVKLVGKSADIPTTSMIPISTNFIVG